MRARVLGQRVDSGGKSRTNAPRQLEELPLGRGSELDRIAPGQWELQSGLAFHVGPRYRLSPRALHLGQRLASRLGVRTILEFFQSAKVRQGHDRGDVLPSPANDHPSPRLRPAQAIPHVCSRHSSHVRFWAHQPSEVHRGYSGARSRAWSRRYVTSRAARLARLELEPWVMRTANAIRGWGSGPTPT